MPSSQPSKISVSLAKEKEILLKQILVLQKRLLGKNLRREARRSLKKNPIQSK
jgi:hypothetical protein